MSHTVRALSRINFVVFSQLVGSELARGVASILVVPCKFGYRNHSKYHSFVVFFLLIPCGTCCHESSRNLCASYLDSWFTVGSVGIHGIRGLLPPCPTTEMFSIDNALN